MADVIAHMFAAIHKKIDSHCREYSFLDIEGRERTADDFARNFEIEEHDAEEIIEWERTRRVHQNAMTPRGLTKTPTGCAPLAGS